MSSSVFTETSSARVVADADSNLVVVYGKNGISFDERAIENLIEEKSISTISVVRLTSPTPSMLDQEEAERLEELEQFLDSAHLDKDDTENDDSDEEHESQTDDGADNDDNSDGVEIKSEVDHITGDDEDNSSNIGGGMYNDDSSETETEAVKVKKRPGRKPKKIKKRKRRKPKERPPVVGLSVEQFYAETTADIVAKNALKLAGLSIFKRTPETDAILEIIRNDHNYTPFTSPEQMRNHKTAERVAMERQAAQSRKIIMQAPPGSIKLFNSKRRVTPTGSNTSTAVLLKPQKQQQQQQPLPKDRQDPIAVRTVHRSGRNLVKIMPPPPMPVEDHIEDDEQAHSSDMDTEEISEESEESRDSDNDRDSDMDFNISGNSRISSKKKQRIKVLNRRTKQPGKQLPPPNVAVFSPSPAHAPPPVQHQQFPDISLRKKPRVLVADSTPKIGQIIQLPANKAPPTVIALGRNIQSTSFLKMRPAQQTHAIIKKPAPVAVTAKEVIRLPPPANAAAPVVAAKVRGMPIIQLARLPNPSATGVFSTPPPQDVKEIVINKNIASPKGVFTNLNSLLGENSRTKSTVSSTATLSAETRRMSPSTSNRSTVSNMQQFNKGFMPIGVETASSHKLPAQIVIETHQSSSELAAENDKQLDLINSIVEGELLKSSLVEQPPVNVDESIPKLVKMLESTAEGLDQSSARQPSSFDQNIVAGTNLNGPTTVDSLDISNARLLETPDEDEITADFLQHVVGLIEEDKQFEAEVVKQVLASTDLNAISSAVDLLESVPILDSVPVLQHPEVQMTDQTLPPMASSTPSRSAPTVVSGPDSPRSETKIVRGNGRIIYLPPIEAPTTRAKRRAQNTTTGSMEFSNISIADYTMDSSSSSISNEQLAGPSIKRTNPRDPSTARRSAMPRRSHTKMLANQTTDAEASESQEDDDDPNKLWCICRQPHNNRFMICCDLCEDWYHGTCVNVTKSMGLEMEQKGIDWKCPKCVKKKEEKCQPRITEMLNIEGTGTVTTEPVVQKRIAPITVSPGNASPQAKHSFKRMLTPATTTTTSNSISPNNPASPTFTKVLHQQQLNFIKLGGSGSAERTACVVCKRSIRSNSSVYCSDDCIKKYAQTAVQQQIILKAPETPLQPLSPTPGSNLTTEAKKNKKKDLFEDVLRQADISVSKVDRINVFERRSGRAITGNLAPTAQQLRKWLQENPTFEVLPVAISEKQHIKRSPPTPETVVVKPRASADIVTKTDSTQLTQLTVNTLLSRKEKEKAPVPKLASPVKTSSTKTEPIRFNVRRTLKEQLLARIKEAQEANTSSVVEWLTALEVEQFAKSVESEMYNSFGRDVGAKYKSKYRSLMFNIKDRKNKTLFEKICAKQVDSKQLVRMTPEQLASQELAKWREEENRHQLDMIKKSELDLLTCSQSYVVKTHKGEEMIATEMDVTLPNEDGQKPKMQLQSEPKLAQSQSQCHSTEADASHDRSSSKEKRHKSHKHHHHHRHHQRNRSRSRSHSRSRSLEKRHRHRHNDSEKAEGKDDERTIASPLTTSNSPLPKKIMEKKTEESTTKPLTTYNLIDQILESQKTVEQAANLKLPTKQLAPKVLSKVQPTPPLDKYLRYLQGVEEWATSLWSGNLSMVDVTDFQVVIHPILGNCQHLGKLLPKKLDVIGRITRVNVWEYIRKIKKSPTKEVVIVNLFPLGPSETSNFDQFYEYLDSRQRLGVLGTDSDQIRDFYIFPLGSENTLPSALQTSERVPFYEDTKRPNTLLGIIVRCLNKRSGAVPLSLNASVPTISTSSSTTTTKKSRSTTTFTPPSSPKRKRSSQSTSSKDDEFDIDAIIKAPIAKMQKTATAVEPTSAAMDTRVDDPNAPYSPGGSSDEEGHVNTSSKPRPNDLERQVHEINKQIAAQQKEIAGLLNVEPTGLTKPTSSSNILAAISIPPNLSKILASLKESSDTPTQGNAIDTNNAVNNEEYNPEHTINATSSYPVIASTKTRSRLAQLSEAELLSMVPDNLADVAATPPTSSNTNRYQQQH